MQLRQHSAAELARRRDAQAVAVAALAVEMPVPEDEAAAPGRDDPAARGLRLRSSGNLNGSKHRICRKGDSDAHSLCKVSMEEPGR